MLRKMKQSVCLIICLIGLIGCSNNHHHYNYIKILTITKTDSVTDLNKGLKTENFLYYSPESDYAIFRFARPAEPETYHTYTGHFRKKEFADTIASLVSLLKHNKEVFVPVSLDTNGMYCGPLFYVEYSDSTGLHYNKFIIDRNDTLDNFCDFFYRLEELSWHKELVNNTTVDETGEIVKMLKGTGSYEKIVKPYVPLPCEKRIEPDKLYGSWRTIGDEFMDTSYKYDIYKIDKSGLLTIFKVENGKTTQEVVVKIKSVKGNLIETEYKQKITILEIINLTDNCFEFRFEQKKRNLRLDRLR